MPHVCTSNALFVFYLCKQKAEFLTLYFFLQDLYMSLFRIYVKNFWASYSSFIKSQCHHSCFKVSEHTEIIFHWLIGGSQCVQRSAGHVAHGNVLCFVLCIVFSMLGKIFLIFCPTVPLVSCKYFQHIHICYRKRFSITGEESFIVSIQQDIGW